jgi:hypothetical protein
MTTYIYESSATANVSANIGTDKVRIATTANPILFAVGFPNVSGNGTVVCATNSPTITGTSSDFVNQLGVGYWIGNSTGVTVGLVANIANATSLTLTANANVEISADVYKFSPYGVPYVDDVLDSSNCPTASGIIPSNTVENNIYVGQGNVISFINAESSNAVFSVTELGMPHADTGTSGYN